MTTKEQEMKVLQQVKKLLATIDPDGWVNTAFAGCISYAETNIENDFADSYKAEAELYRARAEEYKKEANDAREALQIMQARKIETKTRDTIWNFLNYELSTAKVDARNAAAELLETCDNTESDEYKNALRKAQTAKRRAGRLQEMLDGLHGKDC